MIEEDDDSHDADDIRLKHDENDQRRCDCNATDATGCI